VVELLARLQARSVIGLLMIEPKVFFAVDGYRYGGRDSIV
jgi:hypothetical protein